MVPGSAHIQVSDVENLNRRKARKARDAVEPVYDGADAEACIKLFHPVSCRDWFGVIRRLRRGLEPDSETVLRQQARFGRACQPSLARLDRVAGTRHATDSLVRARS